MTGLDGSHQEICAIDLGSRGTVCVVRLGYADVVEWFHERSEGRYRCADQRPCQPYLYPDGWRYERHSLIIRVDRSRKPSQMLSGEANDPGKCQIDCTPCPDMNSHESGCKCDHDEQLWARAYHDTRYQIGGNNHEPGFCDDIECCHSPPSGNLSLDQSRA